MTDVLRRGQLAAAEMAALVASIVDRVPPPHRPLLLAMLERGAGARYRRWAEAAADPSERDALLACAAREESIAETIEEMGANAAEILATFAPHVPALRDAYARVYGDKPRTEKLAIQAAGERRGAEIWRSFAADESNPGVKAALLRCAELEEASAAVLEHLLADPR